MEGKGKEEDHRKRRTDEAEEDPAIKGVSNSPSVARDRKDWRKILEGEVHSGL